MARSKNSLESTNNLENFESNNSFEAGVRHVLNALPDAIAVHRVEACFSVLGTCLWEVATNEMRDGRESDKRRGKGVGWTGEEGQEDHAEGKSGGDGRKEDVGQQRDVRAPGAWSDKWLPVVTRRRMLILACQVTAVGREGRGKEREGRKERERDAVYFFSLSFPRSLCVGASLSSSVAKYLQSTIVVSHNRKSKCLQTIISTTQADLKCPAEFCTPCAGHGLRLCPARSVPMVFFGGEEPLKKHR